MYTVYMYCDKQGSEKDKIGPANVRYIWALITDHGINQILE